MKYYGLGPFFIRVNSRSYLQVPVDRAGAKTKEFDYNWTTTYEDCYLCLSKYFVTV